MNEAVSAFAPSHNLSNTRGDSRSRWLFQIKKILLTVSVFFAGCLGWTFAQDVQASVEKSHERIAGLQDRIEWQRDRIHKGLADKTISWDQAGDFLGLLDAVEKRIKAAVFADGSKTLAQEEYEAYNTYLDANSVLLHEAKKTYHRYADDSQLKNYSYLK